MGPLDSLTPPTDNLYKFAAVFGLILIVLGVSASIYQMTELEKYGLVDDIASAKLLIAIHTYRDAQNQVDQAKKGADGQELAKDLNDANAKFVAAETEFLSAQSTVEESVREEVMQNPMLGALVMAGFGISMLGFTGWYFKVQRYEDIILKEHAKKADAKSIKLRWWNQLFGESHGGAILFVFLLMTIGYAYLINCICWPHPVVKSSLASKSSSANGTEAGH